MSLYCSNVYNKAPFIYRESGKLNSYRQRRYSTRTILDAQLLLQPLPIPHTWSVPHSEVSIHSFVYLHSFNPYKVRQPIGYGTWSAFSLYRSLHRNVSIMSHNVVCLFRGPRLMVAPNRNRVLSKILTTYCIFFYYTITGLQRADA